MMSSDSRRERGILLFAGTSEGRELAEHLAKAGIACTVSVATEYGAQVLGPGKGRRILQGRMNTGEMEEEIRKGNYACVVDSTHPFATRASEQIREACSKTHTQYMRLSRSTVSDMRGTPGEGAPYIEVDTMEKAAEVLRGIPGNLFLMTGSRDLKFLTERIGDTGRIYVRVLPLPESLAICQDCGIEPGHIIAMQGPFSMALNRALLCQYRAAALLTKESGRAGGFEEKIEAALDLGIPVVAVKNPERTEHIQGEGQKVFSSALEVLEEIGHLTGREELCCRQEEEPAELTIVSAGPGGRQHLTREACDAVDQAEIVFGAPSVIEKARQSGLLSGNRPCRSFYQAEKIFSFLQDHTEIRKGTVLVSGDAGLYSGAAMIRKTWEKLGENRIRIRVLPGISSVSALAAALEVSWEDAAVLSIHGRKVNIIRHLQRKSRIFLLTEGPHDLQQTADRLEEALLQGLLPGSLRIGYGYNLSMEGEEKGFISLDQMKTLTKQGLYILYLENPAAGDTPVTACLEDDAFLRRCSPGEENVPMTKEEVRVLALSRLRLTPGAVFYDIGAGTGSISIEAARLCPDATIFAVEKRSAAVRILRENLVRYCLYDVHVVEKAAPEGLRDLPAPTHVFIGGSGKALPDILTEVLLKNNSVRIVLTCITLETLAQVMETVRVLPVTKLRVRQVAAARAEKTGSYHMLKAQNPVFLIDFEGLGDEEGAGDN